jgi:YVTN family beta-propeller protein
MTTIKTVQRAALRFTLAAAAAALSLSLSFPFAAHAAPASDYAASARYTLEGAGKWDFIEIDTVRNRLFVTRADRVEVLNASTGALVGTIADTSGVHGVAFAQALKIGFTSNGKTDSVTVFDLDTLKTLRTIKVSGSNPDALLYHEPTQRLYTFNGKTANVSVIDVKTFEVAQTIDVGGKPELPATDGRHLFVNIEDKSVIAVIDMVSGKMIASWSLADCGNPTGLAFDAKHARLFSVCDNQKMIVTNSKNGKQVAVVAIGLGPDGAAYDPATQTIFTPNGKDGTVTIVHQKDADHYTVTATVPTEKGAKTMAYDASSKRLYLPTVVADRFTVLVVSPK